MIGWRLLILSLPVLLTGCLVSDRPLITARDYAYPLPNSAAGDAYSYDNETHRWTYSHGFTLRRAGAEYVINESNDATPFVLTAIGQGEWLAQTGTSDGRYQYSLLVRNDNGSYSTYDLSALCDALDQSGYSGTGIVKDDDDCVASSLPLLVDTIRADLPDNIVPSAGYIIRPND